MPLIFPIGGGRNDPARGSVETEHRPVSLLQGHPTERLAALNRAVRERGWRGLGLWICSSRNRTPSNEKVDDVTYWTERLAWSQAAGIRYWKVDWGTGDGKRPLWRFRFNPAIRKAAPDVWIESHTQGDIYRTYDVNLLVSIPETIRRIAVYLEKTIPGTGHHRL